jgi:hypothetical protein
MKMRRKSGRYTAMLLGASLMAASALAGGAAAGTVAAAAAARSVRFLPHAAARVGPASVGLAQNPMVSEFSSSAGLQSVYCTTAANCWAVGIGHQRGALLNETLHFNGRHWSRVAVPNPGGTRKNDISELFGVRCTSPGNCWAVGAYEKKGADLGEALHWTGRKWFLVTTPTPGGTLSGDLNALVDVACTSASSCWAAGQYGNLGDGREKILNLTLHWNGRRWSKVSTPNPAGTRNNHVQVLDGVRCGSPADCWAVGLFGVVGSKVILGNEVLHWNGRRWSTFEVPSPGGSGNEDFSELDGVSCTSDINCWAAGTYGNAATTGHALNQALHWNGHKWFKVRTPNPDGTGAGSDNVLIAVTCLSAHDCWTVGDTGGMTTTSATLNEAMHWNGTKWSVVRVPQPGGTAAEDVSTLSGARCTSPTNCWAVGDQQKLGGANKNQILHWNGARWVSR